MGLALLASPPELHAQSLTAAITGTVAHGGTRQYLNAADVRVIGSNLATATDRDGTFAVRNLAAGSYELEVSYAGLDPERRTVTVTARQTVREELSLTASLHRQRPPSPKSSEGVVI